MALKSISGAPKSEELSIYANWAHPEQYPSSDLLSDSSSPSDLNTHLHAHSSHACESVSDVSI